MSTLKPVGTQFRYGNMVWKVIGHMKTCNGMTNELQGVVRYTPLDPQYCSHSSLKFEDDGAEGGIIYVRTTCNNSECGQKFSGHLYER